MSRIRPVPKNAQAYCAALALTAGMAGVLSGADRLADSEPYPRLVGEVLFGTSGFEPGVAAEWRTTMGSFAKMIRPEVLINEDGRPGGAVSLNCLIAEAPMPEGHSLSIGPRLAYHNSDDSGWEGAVLAIYHIDIAPGQGHRHFIEVIGAAGILEDKRDDEDHSARFGGTVGVAYGFQF
jgi:hypothetical protein